MASRGPGRNVDDGAIGTLWVVSGGASLFFLGWALLELVRIQRAGRTPARRWFVVFVLAMVGLVLAGVADATVGGWSPALVGAGFALAGFALFRAARTQRLVLQEGAHA